MMLTLINHSLLLSIVYYNYYLLPIIYYLLSIIIYYSSLLLEVNRYVFHTSCQLKPRNHLQSPMGSNREAIRVAISYPALEVNEGIL